MNPYLYQSIFYNQQVKSVLYFQKWAKNVSKFVLHLKNKKVNLKNN